jgi:hypothetical protein
MGVAFDSAVLGELKIIRFEPQQDLEQLNAPTHPEFGYER